MLLYPNGLKRQYARAMKLPARQNPVQITLTHEEFIGLRDLLNNSSNDCRNSKNIYLKFENSIVTYDPTITCAWDLEND